MNSEPQILELPVGQGLWIRRWTRLSGMERFQLALANRSREHKPHEVSQL